VKIAKLIAFLGFLAMGAALTHAFAAGDLGAEGSQLLSMPWGIVSLVDLYVGFSLFSGWVVYRERSWLRSLIWIVSFMVLGFFAASFYALVALFTCGNNWQRFWQGRRAEGA
jgi:hypothetical protein